ncbi:hypothetical protein IWW48_002046 [Coemansia sp. RSA 1200]|nr:hypothetical protein IWW48_002046 [Coemansia sp. RSA 1200]
MPPDSPASSPAPAPAPAPGARAACAWDSCSAEFSSLHQLAAHLLSAHIDHDRSPDSANSCEWSSCASRGRALPSRSALISHMKAHTGNRSYLCPADGCSKVYKRSDFLARHISTHATQPTTAAPSRLRETQADDASDASSIEDAPLALSNSAAMQAPPNPARKRRRRRSRQLQQRQPSPNSASDHSDDDDEFSDDSAARNHRSLSAAPAISSHDAPEPERQAAMLEAQLAYIRDQVSERKERLLRNKSKMRRLRLENDILIDALART